MFEVRIRPRQALIAFIAFFVILMFVHHTGKRVCETDTSQQQRTNELPIIYAITPTYARLTQKADLTRLSHVFMLVPNLHWIIVEDSNHTTPLVRKILEKAGLSQRSTQLNVITPKKFKLDEKEPKWYKPRGVAQRNEALNWIRTNVNREKHSIVFFMDDDNTYSIELFNVMTKIERGRVGVWPVGLVGGLLVEVPILNSDNTTVIGFNAIWRPERPFAIDMAGFGISTDLLFKNSKAIFSFTSGNGFQETEILQQITTRDKLQPLANNCRDVLVWHTRTEKPKINVEELRKKGKLLDMEV